ncbi:MULTISPECIES: hypothetical protein [unclassified Microbacterium]|uniref:hypothetical protein n=1 Tax=unclassified Microbacterium TaxID=2609290 RepID=UPI00214AC417|nr:MULTISPECIES: hypothetical protein [unclassified Microbacterium]MCR2783077.1 hypothetical protein [Microbacterium sp. zg.B96]WIM16038.1 hypothetical protein QNO11_16165 [Microbacterium sp. zg-B96]
MSTPVAPVPFDARPLTERVDRAAVRAFATQLHKSGRATNGLASSLIALAILVALFVGMMVLEAVTTGASFNTGFFQVLTACVGIAVLGMFISERRAAARRYRLDRFARANGMSYVPEVAGKRLPGMIFDIGSSRQSHDVVRGQEPRFVEFANYVYTTGSGKHRRTHRWGYVAVKLDVPLPHIVLDATGNNSLLGSNLPTTYRKDQRLSLEGDFDRHFALYCPEGYEPDALYLFTPDVMARFIDNAAALDVEIVDDWLFLYTKRPVSSTDPETWAWLFGAVGAVLDKLDQWERWRDDRLQTAATGNHAALAGTPIAAGGTTAASLPFVPPAGLLRPPPGVAPQGRRLARGFPWLAVVITAVIAGVWLVDVLGFGGW